MRKILVEYSSTDTYTEQRVRAKCIGGYCAGTEYYYIKYIVRVWIDGKPYYLKKPIPIHSFNCEVVKAYSNAILTTQFLCEEDYIKSLIE